MTISKTTTRMRFAALLVFFAGVLSACGSDEAVPIVAAASVDDASVDDAAPTAEAPSNDAAAAEAPAATTGVAATIGDSDLGPILAGNNGLTLYGFTNDVEAASTCYGTCAEAWPPVIVEADFAVAPGLDVGIFATTQREDGSLQLVAGKWPLYFFAGDANPGDLAGQGSGDVWFAVDLDGILITDDAAEPAAEEQDAAPAAAVVAVGDTSLGQALVDGNGLTLYGFTNDADGLPTCADACADAWPPILVDSAELPADLDPNVFSVVDGVEPGTFHLKAGKWPLYLFAGDAAPGDVNGQGSGDVWFVADPSGGLITGDNAEPADESASASSDSDY